MTKPKRDKPKFPRVPVVARPQRVHVSELRNRIQEHENTKEDQELKHIRSLDDCEDY